ncbi:Hypothetical predicted protein [Olea europaea subsp. europaea]|uniref:Uncharacterized protein n=1 Tax=Olea europaea subsp. europaea TaxID=158383 RepID=A0A8S0U875_OLEEU|nr:Hypothetical predicted protein [Olea europaea subsp. europaea]
MDKGKNVASPSGSKVLNPFAEPYEPAQKDMNVASSSDFIMNPFARPLEPAPENARTLFMTFSHGFPLAWFEIRDYFTGIYGNCVQYVYIHSSREFGKVVFTTPHMPDAIMQELEVVSFAIRNRPVWLKRYRPRGST